jgi:aspartate carbamoyltransferase catalytic subunit
MNVAQLPEPECVYACQQHPVAQAERVPALLDALPEDLSPLGALAGRHVLSVRHVDRDLLLALFRLAALYEAGELTGEQPLVGRILATVFLDRPHSRAQLSFESAWVRLGGSVMEYGNVYAAMGGHANALAELAHLCNSYGDVAVLRTAGSEAFHRVLPRFRIPLINAGDGDEENPTHALADLYTLFKWRPELLDPDPPAASRYYMGVAGWPARSRTISSFLASLTHFPQLVSRLIVVGRMSPLFLGGQREEVEDAGIELVTEADLCRGYATFDCLRNVLPELDLIYIDDHHRPNFSRQAALNALGMLKEGAMLFHAGLRREELYEALDNSPHNAYFANARGAVYVRMALLAAVAGRLPL